MATVSSNKMSLLIKKGKLPALQVARLIHHHYVKGFSGNGSAVFTEMDLKKLASNLDQQEWRSVSHWVEDGIVLLYAFAMNTQVDAALAAVELLKFSHSRTTNIRRVLWYYEALKIVGDYMNADWTLIASEGMAAMYDALEQTDASIEMDSLIPSEHVIAEWRLNVCQMNIRDFLLTVAVSEESTQNL